METPGLGFDGYALVQLPESGLWRVSAWHDPFEPPPPAPPVGADPREDDGHRYDDPNGEVRTLYCASQAEGALGECLGDFVFSASAAVRVEAFLESDPEPGFDETYQRPLDADDVAAFGWKLAHADVDRVLPFIDVDDWRTYLAAAPRAVPALAVYGVKRFDRHTLLDERRYVTRTMAGVFYKDAADSQTGEPRAGGLRFTSRLPPAWECWAVWGSLAIRGEPELVAVTIDTPQLQQAADMLGVALAT